MPLRVLHAETGRPLPLRGFGAADRLEDVCAEISAVASVPVQAQILLASNGLQVKQSMLSEWLSSQADERIFLFNRLSLDPQNAEQPSVQMSIDIEPPVPENDVSGPKSVQPLDSSSSDHERAVSFAHVFRAHAEYGRALARIAHKHAETCAALMQEQEIQAEALRLAVKNLRMHSKSVFDAFDGFCSHTQKEIAKHAGLLQGFPADLQTLSRIPIHEAITPEPKFLDDYVHKTKLFAWVDYCRIAHDQLVSRTSQLSETIRDLRQNNVPEDLETNDYDPTRLSGMMDGVRDTVSRIESWLQILERDLTRVELTVTEISRSPSQVHDRLQALDHLYQIHRDEYIPEMTRHDRQVRETVVHFSDAKAHLTHVLRSHLQSVSHQQSLIASVPQSLTALTTALNSQSQAFIQLLHVHRMAPAWGAMLVEIVRRKEFTKVFVDKARDLADVFGRFRAHEERRRENFKLEIARYLPSDLVPGLDEKPPNCEVSVSNTKDVLPNLTRDDIAAFEQLVSSMRVEHDAALGSSSEAISKLQAAMLKMMSQVNSVAMEFERTLVKSGISGHLSRLEDENARLRSEIATLRGAADGVDAVISSTAVTPQRDTAVAQRQTQSNRYDDLIVGGRTTATTPSTHFGKPEDTIRAYEARIKNLERLLYQNYGSGSIHQASPSQSDTARRIQVEDLERRLSDAMREQELMAERLRLQAEQLDQTTRRNADITTTYQDMCSAYDRVVSDKQSVDAELSRLCVERDRAVVFLDDIRGQLEGCSRTLHSETSESENAVEPPGLESQSQAQQSSQGSPDNQATTEKGTQRSPNDTSVGAGTVATSSSSQSLSSPSQSPSISLATAMEGIRRQVRVLQDDVTWHAALVANMRNSIHDSQDESDGAQSIAGEIVVLIQRLSDTESRLRAIENELTEAQAHGAILEAELDSVQVLYRHAQTDLLAVKQRERDQLTRLDHLTQELDQTKREAADAVTERDESQKAEQDIKTELEAVRKDIASLRERNEVLSKQLDDHARTQDQLHTGLALSRSEHTRVEAEANRLSVRIREQLEDWSIVCRLCVEQVSTHIDALIRAMHLVLDEQAVAGLVNRDDLTLEDVLAHDDVLKSASVISTMADLSPAPPGNLAIAAISTPNATTTHFPASSSATSAIAAVDQVLRRHAESAKLLCSKISSLGASLNPHECVERIEHAWMKLSENVAQRVAFQDFQLDNLALFLPTRNPSAWAAFNVNTPHYFLDTGSSPEFEARIRRREWILAYITKIAAHVATTDSNPFGIVLGTRYYLCLARPFPIPT